jgi:hypothetical protein
MTLLVHPSDVAHPLAWHYIKNLETYELESYYDAIWETLDTGTYYPASPFAMEQSLKRIESEVARRGYRARESLHAGEYVPVPVFVGVKEVNNNDANPYQPPTDSYATSRRGPRRRFADIYGTEQPRDGCRPSRERSRSRERRRSRDGRYGLRDERSPRHHYSPERGGSSRHPNLKNERGPWRDDIEYPESAFNHGPSFTPNAAFEQRQSPSSKTTYGTSYSESKTSGNDNSISGFNAKTNDWRDPKYGSSRTSRTGIRLSGSSSGPTGSSVDGSAGEPIPSDPYAVLGVSRRAKSSEIEKAHKDLIRAYHPDKHAGKSENSMKHVNDMAAAINEARDLLLDEKAREVYDKTGRKGDQAVKNYEAMRNMQNLYNRAGYSAPRGYGKRGNKYR